MAVSESLKASHNTFQPFIPRKSDGLSGCYHGNHYDSVLDIWANDYGSVDCRLALRQPNGGWGLDENVCSVHARTVHAARPHCANWTHALCTLHTRTVHTARTHRANCTHALCTLRARTVHAARTHCTHCTHSSLPALCTLHAHNVNICTVRMHAFRTLHTRTVNMRTVHTVRMHCAHCTVFWQDLCIN